ncbi:MAG: ferritin family protein [Acidobacteria bacterium]|nr:ferritin family protein [Acidobacteriota bacterium]MBU4307139.1 ferritin family protein [Acidobacteriota bacterium]MBU4405475.1 ferritin family protein [Acidobacteriota bacterium]MCG2812661.1 ferritin family protein [Candidatus Aminicenantes bacterium]
MSYLLSVQEILEFAVYIEERGYEFYIGAIKKFREARITKLFQYLADEEFKHEKVFKKLLKLSGEIKGGKRDPEYQAYMHEFCKTHSLGDREAVNAKLAKLSSLEEILDLAMDFEKDSVIFFSQLKEMYAKGNTAAIDKIIHEEMGHLRKIFQIKRELVKK